MRPRPTWVRPPNSEDARCPGTCGGDDPWVVRGIQSTPWSAASQPDAQLALVFPLELLHRGGRAHDQKQRTAVALGPGSRGSSTWGIYIINSISTQCSSSPGGGRRGGRDGATAPMARDRGGCGEAKTSFKKSLPLDPGQLTERRIRVIAITTESLEKTNFRLSSFERRIRLFAITLLW